MGINFDSLPNSKPNQVPPKGAYYATIEKAEMKQPKDTSKKPYLALTFTLKGQDGKAYGKLFDNLFETDADLVRYKLGRFIKALQIPLTGSFELKDLCKIVVGKSLIVDVTEEKKDGYAPKAIVDVFANEVFYPMSEASNVFGTLAATGTDNDVPFVFEPDAADAPASADADEF